MLTKASRDPLAVRNHMTTTLMCKENKTKPTVEEKKKKERRATLLQSRSCATLPSHASSNKHISKKTKCPQLKDDAKAETDKTKLDTGASLMITLESWTWTLAVSLHFNNFLLKKKTQAR